MKRFIKENRGLLAWLAGLLAFLLLFLAARTSRTLMNWVARCVTGPLKDAVGTLCGHTDASVAEVLCLALVAAAIFWLASLVRSLVTERRRAAVLARYVLVLACIALSIYAGFCLLWGVNYYTDSFQEQSGIYARSGTVAELETLTETFAENLAACAGDVPRDEDGCFAAPRGEIFERSTEVYAALYDEFPFLRLAGGERRPKAFRCSDALSAIGFTGFFFPFTGEANLNVDSPAAWLPSTICHELAHLRGVASEQECNFIAILAATRSDDPAYRYSGWLLGYIYLANALYRYAPDRWQAIRETLTESVVADIRANNAYWAQFEGPVSTAWDRVYDSFLKGYGDADGVQSYGTVVDLLLAYYL